MFRNFVSLFLFSLLFVLSGLLPVYGQSGIPTLTIVTPEDEQVVNGRVEMKFAVENFTLTARPEAAVNSGVIALYVDGKFYTNAATASATVVFPRLGTHKVEAELVATTREAVIPRVSDSVVLHNQKKTPHLYISNIRNGSTLYTEQPSLDIELRSQEYVDQNSYYQVFVDGAVDGDSAQIVKGKSYVLQKALTPGKHRIRVALYGEDGKPYTPVVDSIIDITYAEASPAIASIAIPEQSVAGVEVPFKGEISGFKIPESGRFYVKAGNQEWSFASTSGVLKGLPSGTQKIVFSLVDPSGFQLMPVVSAEKSIEIGDGDLGAGNRDLPQVSGIFMTGGDGSGPNWLLVSLAIVQAGVILVFGIILMTRHSKH